MSLDLPSKMEHIEEQEKDCAICFLPILPTEFVARHPPCDLMIHWACFTKWADTIGSIPATCLLCGEEVLPARQIDDSSATMIKDFIQIIARRGADIAYEFADDHSEQIRRVRSDVMPWVLTEITGVIVRSFETLAAKYTQVVTEATAQVIQNAENEHAEQRMSNQLDHTIELFETHIKFEDDRQRYLRQIRLMIWGLGGLFVILIAALMCTLTYLSSDVVFVKHLVIWLLLTALSLLWWLFWTPS